MFKNKFLNRARRQATILNSKGGRLQEAAANWIRKAPPRPYSIVIQNTTAKEQKVKLFGKDVFADAKNFGNPEGIVFTAMGGTVSYSHVLEQIAKKPFTTDLIRIQSTNTSQVSQPLIVTESHAEGYGNWFTILAQDYFSSTQFQSGIINIPKKVSINGNTYIEFALIENASVAFTFFPEPEQPEIDFSALDGIYCDDDEYAQTPIWKKAFVFPLWVIYRMIHSFRKKNTVELGWFSLTEFSEIAAVPQIWLNCFLWAVILGGIASGVWLYFS